MPCPTQQAQACCCLALHQPGCGEGSKRSHTSTEHPGTLHAVLEINRVLNPFVWMASAKQDLSTPNWSTSKGLLRLLKDARCMLHALMHQTEIGVALHTIALMHVRMI